MTESHSNKSSQYFSPKCSEREQSFIKVRIYGVFSSLLNTSSTSLEFSATILLQVLDLIARAASNNFSNLLYVQNTTVYKMKEHCIWQAEHSSYTAGLGSDLHEHENASAAAGTLSFKFMTGTCTKGRLRRELCSRMECWSFWITPQKRDKTAKKATLNNALVKCVNGCKERKKHLKKKNNWTTDTDI